MEDLTEFEDEESHMYSHSENEDGIDSQIIRANGGSKGSANTQIALNKFEGKTDQLFFEFFGMYTKESIQTKKPAKRQKPLALS